VDGSLVGWFIPGAAGLVLCAFAFGFVANPVGTVTHNSIECATAVILRFSLSSIGQNC